MFGFLGVFECGAHKFQTGCFFLLFVSHTVLLPLTASFINLPETDGNHQIHDSTLLNSNKDYVV